MGGLVSSQLVVRAGEAVLDTAVDSVKAMLSQKFSTVEISKSEFDNAKRIMTASVTSWEESMVHDVTTGIDTNSLDEFAEVLLESLQLTNENDKIKIRKKVQTMKYAKTTQSDILEVSFKLSKYKSVYGFLASVKAKDGTVSFAYAFHSLNFEVELNGFTAEEITDIKNSFGKHQALETLRREGVIQSINYKK